MRSDATADIALMWQAAPSQTPIRRPPPHDLTLARAHPAEKTRPEAAAIAVEDGLVSLTLLRSVCAGFPYNQSGDYPSSRFRRLIIGRMGGPFPLVLRTRMG